VVGPAPGTAGAITTVDAAGTALTRSALTGVIKTAGGVPSVVTGTATDFVRVDGTSAAGGGGGNVTGPSAGTGGEDTNINAAGTVLTRSTLTGVIKQTAGISSVVTGAGTNLVRVDGTSVAPGGGSGDVLGGSNLTTATRVVIVSSAGTVTQGTGCSYASNNITCTGGFTAGDGTAQSGLVLPELTANGTNDFRVYGAANQTVDGCVVFTGALGNGESWRGSATTVTIATKTCRVMETFTPSAGSTPNMSSCFLFTNCTQPQISNRAILVSAAQNKGVVMMQAYLPGPLVLNKWVYYQNTGGASTDGTTVGIYADSSDTPGALEARFVNGDSSGITQKTGTWAVGGGSTIAAGVHWIAISSEGVLSQYYGSGETGLSLSPFIIQGFVASVPRMVSCSNPSTGSGASLLLPASCGTATALTTNGTFMPAILAAR